jgi:hypothetical protein
MKEEEYDAREHTEETHNLWCGVVGGSQRGIIEDVMSETLKAEWEGVRRRAGGGVACCAEERP